ncbi:MAG: Methanol dehydrogenase activator [Bryobacteraceae bacterium]|nr:Methanol dehydrogenase activator [Bryobacteraceae bacterium]
MKHLIRRKLLLDTALFQVTDNHIIDGHGEDVHRLLVETTGATCVVALDGKRRILLVSQYRFPARSVIWELPAGKVDAGETPLQAAKRELTEETGYRARTWKKLAAFYTSPGFLGEKMNLFLATGLTPGDRHPGEGEEHMESRWFTQTQVVDQIRKGVINDAKTIIGIYFLRHLIPRL